MIVDDALDIDHLEVSRIYQSVEPLHALGFRCSPTDVERRAGRRRDRHPRDHGGLGRRQGVAVDDYRGRCAAVGVGELGRLVSFDPLGAQGRSR